MLHAGEEPYPHYKVIASVPEGQLDDERAASAFSAITTAILAAEDGRYDQDPLRIWVIGNEIPDGNSGRRRSHRPARRHRGLDSA